MCSDIGTEVGVGTSSGWVLLASFVMASDPGSYLSPDFVNFCVRGSFYGLHLTVSLWELT